VHIHNQEVTMVFATVFHIAELATVRYCRLPVPLTAGGAAIGWSSRMEDRADGAVPASYDALTEDGARLVRELSESPFDVATLRCCHLLVVGHAVPEGCDQAAIDLLHRALPDAGLTVKVRDWSGRQIDEQ
jgi:hypothetical protein